MAKLLKLRRGTTSQHGSFTGAEGEVTVDTDKETLVVHDGSTAGGHPVAAEDMANVSSANITGRLGTGSIVKAKLEADIIDGTKLADNAVDSEHYTDGSIDHVHLADDAVDGDIIAADAVTGAHIADDAVGAEHIEDLDATVKWVDSAKAIFGTDTDLEVFHTGSNGMISNNTGALSINTDTGEIQINKGTSEYMARFIIDDAVELYFNNSKKIATTNTGVDITGNIAVSGTVDGRDVATDGTKLDGIEASATADQTNAEIRAAVEAASDSNVFTDADHSKLNAIEASATADQTAAEIRTAVEAASDSNVFTDADHTKLNGIETSATADQTASEIVALVAGQAIAPSTVYATSNIGKDSGDFISFTTDTQMDVTINGNNEFRFEADGDFHADGDVIAESTTISSDAKLKESIQVVPNALDKVQQLNGVTFNWIRNGQKSAGVIAQDVLKVLPEAVKEVTGLKDNEKHLTVNYHALTSILIESIKELKAEVEALKAGGE